MIYADMLCGMYIVEANHTSCAHTLSDIHARTRTHQPPPLTQVFYTNKPLSRPSTSLGVYLRYLCGFFVEKPEVRYTRSKAWYSGTTKSTLSRRSVSRNACACDGTMGSESIPCAREPATLKRACHTEESLPY